MAAKTTWTDADPVGFIEAVEQPRRATGAERRMSGSAIVGFGEHHDKYATLARGTVGQRAAEG